MPIQKSSKSARPRRSRWAFVQKWYVTIKGRRPYIEYTFFLENLTPEQLVGKKKASRLVGKPVRRKVSEKDYRTLLSFQRQFGDSRVWSYRARTIVSHIAARQTLPLPF
jgi:hypothetical protein